MAEKVEVHVHCDCQGGHSSAREEPTLWDKITGCAPKTETREDYPGQNTPADTWNDH